MIEDPNQSVREESAVALGKIGDQKAVPVLIEALKDDYKNVQLATARALTTLTGEDFGRDYDGWVKWYEEKGV